MSPDGPKIASPEEKLLRLIRGKGYASAAAPQGPAATQPTRVSGGKHWRVALELPAHWLAAINISLGCLLGIELMALAVIAIQPAPLITVPLPPALGSSEQTAPQAAEPMPSLASAVAQPLFQAVGVSGSARRTGVAPSTQARALAERFSVIGVVAGDPSQAILEDGQTKKTYFVTQGQGLIEGLVVDEIREHRVVLDLNGEKIELSL